MSIKLAVIVALSHMDLSTPLRKNTAVYVPSAAALIAYGPAKPYVWSALPAEVPRQGVRPEEVDLGRRLFFDRNLSRDGTIACASCHDLAAAAGADGRATSIGVAGATGTRNAPTVINAAFQTRMFWDGRVRTLEEQARGPLTNPREMAMPSEAAVEEAVRRQSEYELDFATAFGPRSITIRNIVAAISAFERTLIAADSPYDRFVRGDATALSAQQKRGMNLFRDVGCTNCHAGPNFSVASVFSSDGGLRLFPANPTALRAAVAVDRRLPAALAAAVPIGLRVPSLRNVARTAPYFHDGSISSLEQAVAVMAAAQLGLSIESEGGEFSVQPAGGRRAVSLREQGDIVAFLKGLSGDIPVTHARLSATTGRSPGPR